MIVRLRRDVEKNWLDHNPILDDGELVYVSDKEYFKIGDAKRTFKELKVFNKEVPIDDANLYAAGYKYKLE